MKERFELNGVEFETKPGVFLADELADQIFDESLVVIERACRTESGAALFEISVPADNFDTEVVSPAVEKTREKAVRFAVAALNATPGKRKAALDRMRQMAVEISSGK